MGLALLAILPYLQAQKRLYGIAIPRDLQTQGGSNLIPIEIIQQIILYSSFTGILAILIVLYRKRRK